MPYLLFEESPADPPASFDRSPTGSFSFDAVAFKEWRRICGEIRAKCVKLAWEPQANRAIASVMFRAFQERVKDVISPLRYGDDSRYLTDCGVPADAREAFRRQLIDVGNWANEQERLSREALYKRYIVADDTPAWEGKYDPSKPFCFALKQLFDLNYTVNLTDALGLYTLTPIDSLPRTSLQELTVAEQRAKAQGAILEPKHLESLASQFAFDLTQGGLYLKSMGDLSLQDVLAIRDRDEWHAYIQAMQALLADTRGDPRAALEGNALQGQMRAIYARYKRLMRVTTDYVKRNRDGVAEERWTPLATLLIDIGGALFTLAIVPPSAGFGAALVYGVAGNILQNKAGMVARMLIRGTASLGAQADLQASLDFMRARFTDAKSLMHAVGTGDAAELHVPIFEKAGFKFVKDLGKNLTHLYDETVNFPEDVEQDAAEVALA